MRPLRLVSLILGALFVASLLVGLWTNAAFQTAQRYDVAFYGSALLFFAVALFAYVMDEQR